MHFSIKIWYLVATILIIFLRLNWPCFPASIHSGNLSYGNSIPLPKAEGERCSSTFPPQFDHCKPAMSAVCWLSSPMTYHCATISIITINIIYTEYQKNWTLCYFITSLLWQTIIGRKLHRGGGLLVWTRNKFSRLFFASMTNKLQNTVSKHTAQMNVYFKDNEIIKVQGFFCTWCYWWLLLLLLLLLCMLSGWHVTVSWCKSIVAVWWCQSVFVMSARCVKCDGIADPLLWSLDGDLRIQYNYSISS